MRPKDLIYIIIIVGLNVSFKTIGQIVNINLDDAFNKKQKIHISEIAYSVEYIALETKPVCRCGAQVRVYCNEKYIITVSVNNILVFDRKTGAFIAEVGKSDEIYSTYYVIPFDERRNVITFKSTPNTLTEYSLLNSFLKEIQLPVDHGNSVYWKGGNYVQFVANVTGNDNRRLIVFRGDNSVIKVFTNKNRFIKTVKAIYYSNKEGGFYWFDNNMHFKETFIDTIYQVTQEKLIPKYCFNEGDHGLDYSTKGKLELRSKQKYFFISNIYETENFLFFYIEYGLKFYSGIYFKNEENCKISDYCLINRAGFVNDLDNFIPFHFLSVNNSNELVGFCIPAEIEKWKKENEINITDEERLRILKVHADNNPVVIIAKLK